MVQQLLGDGGRNGEPLSPDQALELLCQYQRREIIRRLMNESGQEHSIDDLLEYLAAVERDRSGPVPGQDHLLSAFVHVHGPKLEAAGLVEYDVHERRVVYRPNERVESLLDAIDAWMESS